MKQLLAAGTALVTACTVSPVAASVAPSAPLRGNTPLVTQSAPLPPCHLGDDDVAKLLAAWSAGEELEEKYQQTVGWTTFWKQRGKAYGTIVLLMVEEGYGLTEAVGLLRPLNPRKATEAEAEAGFPQVKLELGEYLAQQRGNERFLRNALRVYSQGMETMAMHVTRAGKASAEETAAWLDDLHTMVNGWPTRGEDDCRLLPPAK